SQESSSDVLAELFGQVTELLCID
ncbi:MAG: hypothetical protein QOK11_799, partial [Pseudonocardiales bacterium]|nr:hypothetical protein [Pseudonocardiales bacterium]